MVAINRKMVNIAILDAGTNPSSVDPTVYIKGEIKSYTKSGGEADIESDPHFGGDVTKEKPRSQIEVSFEVTPSLDDATKWESIAYATKDVSGQTVYVSNAAATDKVVYIEADDGVTGAITYGFNNCQVTTLDISHNADDNMTKTLNLKLSSEDETGISNFMAVETTIQSCPEWSTLTSD